jgi:hypothetical protein
MSEKAWKHCEKHDGSGLRVEYLEICWRQCPYCQLLDVVDERCKLAEGIDKIRGVIAKVDAEVPKR